MITITASTQGKSASFEIEPMIRLSSVTAPCSPASPPAEKVAQYSAGCFDERSDIRELVGADPAYRFARAGYLLSCRRRCGLGFGGSVPGIRPIPRGV